ncbi:unnamed protein product [Timema podura]|uniref:Uncharacterized protein n=1 Tax=Timema podura TaxID=61482 RepID=A0ABN7P5E8_TIMPD|nr:unnamed protein product [Timema podura]
MSRVPEPEMEDMELIASSDTNPSSLPCRTALAAILAAVLVFCLGEVDALKLNINDKKEESDGDISLEWCDGLLGLS